MLRIISRFLWIPLVIYLLVLIGLGHYYRPQSDDLGWFYIVQQLGTKGTLQWLWQTNGGRFFSHLLIIGAVKTGWPITIPWLIPAITLLCQWIASFCFLRAINIYFPKCYHTQHPIFYSLVLTLVPMILVPQLSTALYWYTGAALYQWAYILTIFLFTAFIEWLYHKQLRWLIITVLLLICTGNTNELSSLFINLGFILVCGLLYRKNAIPLRILFLLSGVALVSLTINLSAPGLYLRNETMAANKTMYIAPLSWGFWLLAASWQILSLPISWILAAEVSTSITPTIKRKNWWLFFGVLATSLLLVLYGTGGSLALRTFNALTVFLFILLMAGLAGQATHQWEWIQPYKKWLFTMAVLASPLSYQIFQTWLSAPYFAIAYNNQRQAISHSGTDAPRLVSIQTVMDSLVDRDHGRQFIRQRAKQMPALLWFNDPSNEKNTVLQMLRLGDKDSLYWGNQKIFNDHYSFPVSGH